MQKKKESNRSQKKTQFKISSTFWYILALLILGIILFFSFETATGNAVYSNWGYSLESGLNNLSPFLGFFLGGEYYDGQLLFERFLFFLIILAMVSLILRGAPLFSNQKGIAIVVSIAVSILSVRYINYEWLRTAIMSYSVLGVAIMSFLPFILYFFFLNGLAPKSSGARKIGWILFICIYLGLFFTTEERFYGQVYIWTAAIAFLFLLLDGTIHRYLAWEKVRAMGKSSIEEAEIELRRRMHALRQDLTAGIITQPYFDSKIKEYESKIKSLHKHS